MAKGRLVRHLLACPAAEAVRRATERRAVKAPLPPKGYPTPGALAGATAPLETGGKVARLLAARHKSKGIKELRKVPEGKVTLPPGDVAN